MSSENMFAMVRHLFRPPRRRPLSEWADENFYLSSESSAEPGRWKTLPYQRGVMDAITDPSVERVFWMKSARVGATKGMDATIGYYMDEDPCPIMVVQPTIDDAKGFSQDEITPMLRDVPVLRELVGDPTVKSSGQTIKRKEFPGGVLQLVGANSPTGFRRVTRRVVIFDEVDGYPASAGDEGDPIKLGIKRTETFWNRKIIAASTPSIAGSSRIEKLFESGDQRRYHVPCPHCGHRDILSFRESSELGGHWMQWDEGEPETAHFVCSENGCIIEERDKMSMLEAGEWVAAEPFKGIASFHIWAAYSVFPNATWSQIATEFLDCKDKANELKVFVNTVLGETWVERGEAPEWHLLYARRESYIEGTVPAGARLLTAGVDVQIDRLLWEVVGWGYGRENWSIAKGIIYGDTAKPEPWRELDVLQARTFRGEDGLEWPIKRLAIDSGYRTQIVYGWAMKHPISRVIAVKGVATSKVLIGAASAVEVTTGGRSRRRGYRVFPVSGSIAKGELVAWLKLEVPVDGEPYPPGFCHFPEYDDEFFKQLTAEQLVPKVKRDGHVVHEWQVIPGRENHFLDTRVYARAAAALEGVDRWPNWAPESAPARPPHATTERAPDTPRETPKPNSKKKRRRSSFWGRR